ncbi:1-Acyl-sn-glycerol-3-phosphate acyltransferase [Gluconobacter morbifer G707]|uniref:1-Acyl-sn-glycerol-3-phosphate acyltransferase n=2 Tax=Gluconobacter TaxID=441 RepID=G6XGV3_9PROT|nr:lysophospholipid acyltransferase family protein [Gluconobacter morbifer]EHH69411.1 1-Acyl-sn-glycerol-3-phosphate acyltransferase [Gluconobacter morbifer G707]
MSHHDAQNPSSRRSHSRPVLDENADFSGFQPTTPSTLMGRVQCVVRLVLVLLWGFWICSIQGILIRLPGPAKILFPRLFWKGIGRILGIRTRVVGRIAGGVRSRKDVERGARPVVYVANHCSWLDIVVIGSVLPVVFVAKGEIGAWPLIGSAARVGGTIFVSRNRRDTGREVAEMAARLRSGSDIVLFPEGTSSDGSRVLQFMSSFFAIAKPGRLERKEAEKAPPVLIQPISLVYDRLEGLPVGRSRRNVFSWYGDMDLTPHIWSFGQWRSMGATLLMHPPLDPDDFKSRKQLANATFQAVNEGAAELRHGRRDEDET